MTFDPFADSPTDATDATSADTTSPWDDTPTTADIPDQRQPEPRPHPHEPGAHKVRVTLKAGPGYEAPWITVDGVDVADAAVQLSDGPAVDKLVRLTSNVAKHFHSTYGPGQSNGNGNQSRQLGKPAAAEQAPDGEERFCKHGQRKYMSGISKSSGKAYKGFFCQSADRSDQCKPEFVR